MSDLVDTFNRTHRDLRVSLTDRCSLRCTYCMPQDFDKWLPSHELLTTDELVTVIDVATEHGINQVRLTGGEPLLRPDIVDIVARINSLPNPPELSVTTNGLRLADLAAPLFAAGLVRVNISLDTLDRDRFKTLTFRDRIGDVFKGIKAAREAGLTPIKINSVLMPGINDDEAPALLHWALEEGLTLRFIEQMPLDAGGIWDRSTMVSAEQILTSLSPHFALTPVPARGSAPAEEFYIDGGTAKVGIIASVSQPFCGACDRLRLTSDGQLRSCLFSRDETDLRKVLRNHELSNEEVRSEISRRLQKTVLGKLAGHGINDPSFIQPTRPMSAIGG
ncbi:MAG: GTP 3',8-cyclase MoaA [Candidatus Nanopelagicaceae bacterium]|nr:GTP 3',8-cyclase MoaA [Candidatus Nanopelagicaceae bacterium]